MWLQLQVYPEWELLRGNVDFEEDLLVQHLHWNLRSEAVLHRHLRNLNPYDDLPSNSVSSNKHNFFKL